jgi:hypothetical protein
MNIDDDERAVAWNLYLYICWSKYAQAAYTATSMFHDLFPGRYTKPVYVEKTPRTSQLSGKCRELHLLGRTFYSLIKDPGGVYRFNSSIYQDVQDVLGLEFDRSPNLTFDLIKLPSDEVEKAYSPADAYARARATNRSLQSAVQYLLREIPISEDQLGLIGSVAVDNTVDTRDVDVVFHGSTDVLDLANKWILQGDKPGPPFRRVLPSGLPIVCGFFSAQPSAYPDLRNLQLLEDHPHEIEVALGSPASPSYLNVQTYTVLDILQDKELLLIVRDPLGRDALQHKMTLFVRGYRALLREKPSLLVTDVESQLRPLNFHAGGTRCSEKNGV